MQFDSLRAFPYPVLRPDVDDYTDGEMQVTVDIKPSSDGLTVKAEVQFALSVKEIAALVSKGKATYTVVFACRDTYFRHAQNSSTPIFEVSFPRGHLRGEVQIYPYVVASCDIENYKCSLLNPEFGAGPFTYAQGSLLAIDRPQVVYVDRDAFHSLASCVVLVSDDNLTEQEWRLDASRDKMHIMLNPELKKRIDRARNDTKNRVILFNSIYFSAVMQCVGYLKHKDEGYDDCRWAQVIRQKCHDLHLDIALHSEYIIAQKLMHNPLGRADAYFFQEANE